MLMQSTNATTWMESLRTQSFILARRWMKNRAMPSWLSEKVRNTFIEYIVTSVPMSPWV
jgi:hypothetical protein